MGLFFKGKAKLMRGITPYMEDQKAVFDTKGDKEKTKQQENYDQYVMRKKDYSNVPKYKAFDEKSVGVVIDKDQLGYQQLNECVQTVEIEKENLYSDLQEIVSNPPIESSHELQHKSIDDKTLETELPHNSEVDVIEVENNEIVISDISEERIEKDKKLSIFGNSDEPIKAKVYDIKETPITENVDIIDIEFKKEELKPEVKLNEQGQKICPKCGAPLDPRAPVCFLCGHKF
ncbi:MAG: zinc ribbon domain-containing protein [Firmicutes bacterium]|nr:zinc ribbon domain-containing protein [Bacillota bacterium]